MGFLDKARRKAERPLTDAAIESLRQLRPDLAPSVVAAICPAGEAHYGVLAQWTDGAAIFLRCHPNWYAQRVSLEVATELSRAQHPGGSLSYAMDAVSPGFTNTLAPAQIDPRTAAVHMASALESLIQESRPAASAPAATAAVTSNNSPMSHGESQSIQSMVDLEHILKRALPETHIERLFGPDAAGLRVGFGTTITVDAWPLPDRWRVTLQTVGPDGPYRKSYETPRDALLTKIAGRVLLTLGHLGSRYIDADASGLHVRDDFEGHQGTFLNDYAQCLWLLARWSIRQPRDSNDENVLRDVGAEMMVFLEQKRPDLYTWCKEHVNNPSA